MLIIPIKDEYEVFAQIFTQVKGRMRILEFSDILPLVNFYKSKIPIYYAQGEINVYNKKGLTGKKRK